MSDAETSPRRTERRKHRDESSTSEHRSEKKRHRTDKEKRTDQDEEERRHRKQKDSQEDAVGEKLKSSVTIVSGTTKTASKESDAAIAAERKRNADIPSGGAYIPPAKLRQMRDQIKDKSSDEYQRLAWEHLKKRIHGQVNKINVSNLTAVVGELLQENIVRGKGLLARSVLQAQQFSPTFSHVYSALVSIINSKFPHIGELVLRRLIIQFKRSFRRNDKQVAINSTKFIAHLINQQVAHEVLALEILTLLLETPTDDSVEVAIAFLKECGAKLTEVSPRGMSAIFDRLRSVLNESHELDKRTQYMIEVMFQVRKDKFAGYPAVVEELDLVADEDQITHTVALDDAQDPENTLNVFRADPEYEKNEEIYSELKREILGEDEDANADEENEDGEETADGAQEGAEQKEQTIIDNTETNLVAFRRMIYLTIQSSLDFQECAHKLLKIEIKPGLEIELCHMILDCCAQQRTYEKFFGLLAERFCRLRKEYQGFFEQIFRDTYDTIHRFELMKLRNATKLFAHLLFTDAISWTVLAHVKLNEDDTTSSSRIFIKILFQELSEFLGMEKLYDRIRDVTLQEAFDGLFPRNNPRDTRFAINFFTSIGLGGLTVDLREHLKSAPVEPLLFPQLPTKDATSRR